MAISDHFLKYLFCSQLSVKLLHLKNTAKKIAVSKSVYGTHTHAPQTQNFKKTWHKKWFLKVGGRKNKTKNKNNKKNHTHTLWPKTLRKPGNNITGRGGSYKNYVIRHLEEAHPYFLTDKCMGILFRILFLAVVRTRCVWSNKKHPQSRIKISRCLPVTLACFKLKL